MSEEKQPTNASYDFTGDPDGLTLEDFRRTDPILAALLTVALGEDDADASIGITVSTRGTVVTGLAVSLARWTKLWTSRIRDVEGAEGLADALAPIAASWVEQRAAMVARRTGEDLPTPGSVYLNLKDAVLWTGGQRIAVGMWRVDKRSIDGWSLAYFPD